MSTITDLPVPAPVWRDPVADQLRKPVNEPKPAWYFVGIDEGIFVFSVRATYTPREEATRDQPAVKAELEILEVQLDGRTIGGKDDKGVWHDLTRYFQESMWTRIENALFRQLAGRTETPRFKKVSCSQCGGEFGPRDDGYSHCENHRRDDLVRAAKEVDLAMRHLSGTSAAHCGGLLTSARKLLRAVAVIEASAA